MKDFFYNGKTYKMTDKGYHFCDGSRVSKKAFEEANAAYLQEIMDRNSIISDSIKNETVEADTNNEEEDMNKAACNVIEKDGHEYVRDFVNGKYYCDGEEISKTKWNKVMGIHKASNTKKSTKRRSKDVAFEAEGVTLTAKQLDFMNHLEDDPYSVSPDYGWWVDLLQDNIGGQFAGKPMTVGAMISTLREKGLMRVEHEKRDNGDGKEVKCRSIYFTDLGRRVYDEVMGR